MCPGAKKLVILGIPWDIDSEGLRLYMSKFGDLADVMVMKDRASGRSRGFGYVTFSSLEDAEKVLAAQHILNGRTLDVKVATPKEEMVPPSKKSVRIFVARIPISVTDEDFHSYFGKYGPVIDAYMPKEPVTKQHRGIGFVTYENPDSVDKVMSETHELGGSTIAVDRATPKDDSRSYRASSHYVKTPQAQKLFPSGIYSAQASINAGHMVLTGDISSAGTSSGQAAVGSPMTIEKKMFIGRVPVETTAEDLQAYFSQFGWVVDVYLPKDPKKRSHRGFGFVTFADEATAARVARRRHYIHGREIAVDTASPTDRTENMQFPENVASLGGGQDLSAEVAARVATNNNILLQPSTGSTANWGNKLFIGRIPIEATAIDLRVHFSQFGHVKDVYLPKDDKKISHRGFGFITFADEVSAEYASQKIHMILGQKIVLDRAAPLENGGVNIYPSPSVPGGTSLDGSVPALQNSSSQQAYDARLVQSRDRLFRSTSRYRPY